MAKLARMTTPNPVHTLLAWHEMVGADALIGHEPCSMLEVPAAQTPPATAATPAAEAPAAPAARAPARMSVGAPIPSLAEALAQAKQLASAATDMPSWRESLDQFDGCPLKRTANKTVAGDGNPASRILFLGEAPGSDEDREGIPFCGASGQLLDKMLAAIDLMSREDYFISNTIYWRPPGNRNPTPDEIAICRPFVDKLIEIMQPEVVVLIGGVAAKSMLDTEQGITKLRGKPQSLRTAQGKTIPAFALYHPSYLLRQPLKKREAWADLQALQCHMKA